MQNPVKSYIAAGLLVATGGVMIGFLGVGISARTINLSPRPRQAVERPPASLSVQRPGPVLAVASPQKAKLHAVLGIITNASGSIPTAAGHAGVLDRPHLFALGMIETGNHDGEIGGAGEVSRYQIMPSVWRRYSASSNYRDPEASLVVAQRHWATLYNTFKQQAGREPTDFDMYVLWNTHYGYYAGRKFDPARLAPSVRERAQRYVNLVECGET